MQKRQVLFGFIILVIGFIGGFLSDRITTQGISTQANVRGSIIRGTSEEFTAPILACEVAVKGSFRELKPTEDALTTFISRALSERHVQDISVYLRTLNSGRWIGINEETKYIPASLFKTIIMIGYLKVAEETPGIFVQKLIYNGSSFIEEIPRANKAGGLVVGEAYSIEELIRRMIVYSSNPALDLLLSHADARIIEAIEKTRIDLKIPLQITNQEDALDIMTPEQYSMVFRVLYGATYLNQEMSELALKLLSETDFREGIVAGVPENITIAHKFGARSSSQESHGKIIHELHDCGIIYYPKHPYLLCVMTQGEDFNSLAKTVQEISRIAYASLDEFFED
ncbi:MAG: serine hydrolase [Patescibacteria group bacterium]